MLTNQMQKIDEAVERANLVNKLFYFYFFFHIDIFIAIGILRSIIQKFLDNRNLNV
jgi:hypothetical protein